MRISSIAGALAFGFLVVTFAIAQTSSKDDLRGEISLLKQKVQNHEKRIAELERTIAELKASQNPPLQKKTSKSDPLTPGDWKVPSNWDRVVLGMTPDQVRAIPGRATFYRNPMGNYDEFVYEGDVSGSGKVSGNVKFFDNRAFEINKPVF